MSKPESSPAYRITITADSRGVIAKWLSGIPEREQQEYVAIDREFNVAPASSEEACTLMDVGKDWIEEHGGERWWWMFLQTGEASGGRDVE